MAMIAAMAGQERSEAFSANRARGRIDLVVGERDGITRRTHVHESGSLRVRFPRAVSEALEAVLVNTAGGMAGGDRFAIKIAAGERARLVVTTTAAEKIYRAIDSDTAVDVKIEVEAEASLSWLPQETILFDRARLVRRIEVDLADTARLILAEALVFGRSGMGEMVKRGFLFDQWRIRRAGKLIHAEGLRLDGNMAEKLAVPALAKGGIAVATLLIAPGDDAVSAAALGASKRMRGEVGVSSWNGLAVVRFCAGNGETLRYDVMQVLAALHVVPLPRLWTS